MYHASEGNHWDFYTSTEAQTYNENIIFLIQFKHLFPFYNHLKIFFPLILALLNELKHEAWKQVSY